MALVNITAKPDPAVAAGIADLKTQFAAFSATQSDMYKKLLAVSMSQGNLASYISSLSDPTKAIADVLAAVKALPAPDATIPATLAAIQAAQADEAKAIARITAPVSPAPVPVVPAPSDALPAVGYDAVLWDYSRKWVSAQWGNAGPTPYAFDHVQLQPNGDVRMLLDANGAADFRAGAGTPAQTTGLWEADVTLPQMRSGVVVAPLWLYDGATGDEIDFEFTGRTGLLTTIHSGGQANGIRHFDGQDFSGKRVRFGIEVKSDAVNLYMDKVVVQTWTKATSPVFVSKPLQPFFEMWPINRGSGWVDDFTPFAAGESMEMIVHGYRYTAS